MPDALFPLPLSSASDCPRAAAPPCHGCRTTLRQPKPQAASGLRLWPPDNHRYPSPVEHTQALAAKPSVQLPNAMQHFFLGLARAGNRLPVLMEASVGAQCRITISSGTVSSFQYYNYIKLTNGNIPPIKKSLSSIFCFASHNCLKARIILLSIKTELSQIHRQVSLRSLTTL